MRMLIFGFMMLIILLGMPVLMAGDGPTDRGSCIIGGSLSYSVFFYHDRNISDFYFETEFQYFVVRGFAVGVDLYFDRWKVGSNGTTQYGIGPSLAYYLSLKDPNGYPFVRAAAIYHHDKESRYVGENSRNDFKFRGSIGYTYLISRNIGLVGSLDYTYERDVFLGYDLLSEWRDVFGLSIGLKAFIY
jgi:hypothetical protein